MAEELPRHLVPGTRSVPGLTGEALPGPYRVRAGSDLFAVVASLPRGLPTSERVVTWTTSLLNHQRSEALQRHFCSTLDGLIVRHPACSPSVD